MTRRDSGSLLMELMLALAVLTVGALSFMGAFYTNSRAHSFVDANDEASSQLSSIAELLYSESFRDVYANYNGAQFEVSGLQGGAGPAVVSVLCYVDENSIPAEFGDVTDIDGNPGTKTSDASATYELLPVHLKISYSTGEGDSTADLYLLLDDRG